MFKLKTFTSFRQYLNLKAFNYSRRQIHSKLSEKNNIYLVPRKPTTSKIDKNLLPPKTIIDSQTIALLERLSLVDCANKQSIGILEDAIHFADQILQVDTTAVDPLVTVLEDRPLRLREDIVAEGNIKDDILSNASKVEEDYLVAPPGNIAIEDREDLLHEKKISQ